MGELATIGRGDRQELRRITKGRVAIVKQELEARETELIRQAKQELRNERKAALKTASRKVEAINKKVAKLNREAIAVYDELFDLGLEINGYDRYYDREELVKSNLTTRWQPEGFEEQFDEVRGEIRRQRVRADIDLDKQELELLEELSVDALTSDAARDFLAQIPTVEQVLPAPNVQELTR